MTSFSINDVPQKTAILPWQEIDDSVLVLQPKERAAHEFNNLAAFIWQTIDGEKSTSDILEFILDEFDVESDIAKTDLIQFLNTLREKKLLK